MPAVVSPAAGAVLRLAGSQLLLADAWSGVSAAAAATAAAGQSSSTAGEPAVGPTLASALNVSWEAHWSSTPADSTGLPSATITTSVEEANEETSLVPLFILLAAFGVIVAGCVMMCQRLRSRRKDRFAGELCRSPSPPSPSRGRGSSVDDRATYGYKYETKGRLARAFAEPAMCLTCTPPAGGSPPALRSGNAIVDRGRGRGEKPGRATVTFADEAAPASIRPALRGSNFPAAATAAAGEELAPPAALPTADGCSAAPAAAFRLHHKVPVPADRIVVVKQIHGSDAGKQRLDSSAAAGCCRPLSGAPPSADDEHHRCRDATLGPDERELRVALLENEELTIHSSDGHVFQVALLRASGPGPNAAASRGTSSDLPGVHCHAGKQQQRRRLASGEMRVSRRRTMSDGPSTRRAVGAGRGRQAAAAAAAQAGAAAGTDPQVDCREVAAALNQRPPTKAASLELAVGMVSEADPELCLPPLARPKSRLQLSSASESSSQDENECASLLTKETSCCPDADAKLLGSFAASSAGEAVTEHSR